MALELKTPQGTVDLSDPAAAQPELIAVIERLSTQLADARRQRQVHAQESGRHRRRAEALAADGGDATHGQVNELRVELRAEKRKAARRDARIAKLVAEKQDLAAAPKKLKGEVSRLTSENRRYRNQIAALKSDLNRARRKPGQYPGPALTDMQIAFTHLSELHDRLIGEARKTSSRAAAAALRLAAREVTRIRQQMAQRSHLEDAAA